MKTERYFSISAGREKSSCIRSKTAPLTAAHLVANEAEGHGAVTRLLKELGVNIVICGNIGGCAQKAVREAGWSCMRVLLLVLMMRLTHFYQIILHMTPR